MARTQIKICGLREPEHIECAVDCGADYVGMVFAEGSPRQVQIAEARTLVATLFSTSKCVEPVALFSNQSIEFVDEVLENVDFRYVQLHGDEDRVYVEQLDDLKVFKAVPFDPEKIDEWRNPPENVAALLVDAPTLPGELTGGTGRVFNWQAFANLDRAGLPPIMLAGGLTAENVGEAISVVRPFAVDVSSGVEVSRGVKDAKLIRRFIEAVKSADSELD